MGTEEHTKKLTEGTKLYEELWNRCADVIEKQRDYIQESGLKPTNYTARLHPCVLQEQLTKKYADLTFFDVIPTVPPRTRSKWQQIKDFFAKIFKSTPDNTPNQELDSYQLW